MGRVVAIYLRPSSRTPVKRVEQVEVVAGRGLAGDHAGGGSRQITLLDREAWQRACDEIGQFVDPGGRRANVVIDGLALANTIGTRLRIGPCLVDVIGETAPCRLMDELAPGMLAALRPERRAGVYGRIIQGGELAVGDPAEPAGCAGTSD